MTQHRKGQSKFDLNKDSGRDFDLEKKPKRTFDLSKDTDEEVVETVVEKVEVKQPEAPGQTAVKPESKKQPAAPKQPETSIPEPPAPETGSSGARAFNRWIIIFFLILAIALLAWWLWPVNHDGKETSLEDMVENPVDSTDAEAAASEADSAIAPAAGENVSAEAEATVPAEEAPVETPEKSANANSGNAAASSASSAASATPAATAAPSGDIEAEAMKVIRGDYGNNPGRREALGSRYSEVQKRVNQLMRK